MKQNYFKWLLAFLISAAMLGSPVAMAQDFSLTGTVEDITKQPVIGAVVVVSGTSNAVLTDVDGKFTINTKIGDVLEVKFVGYVPKKVSVESRNPLTIQLLEDVFNVDDVVVIGYGTLKKSDLTGAVESVKSADISKRQTANPAEALQGLVAGVNVQKFGGKAGDAVSIKIRGVNTFGDNEPLYIIDGFPGSINSVNPLDIENMEVLKDAAAAAIYGSVAANGVIIITTKSGKSGQITFDLNSSVVFTNTAKRFDLLDAKGYVNVHRQMYDNYNSGVSKPIALPEYITNPGDVNTNWQNEIFRPGVNFLNSVSMRGGTETIKFALSANLADEKGVVIDNAYRQRNFRAKVNAKKGIFVVDANMAYNATRDQQPNFQLKEAYMIAPLVPVYDGSEVYGFGLTNKKQLPNNVNVVGQEHYVSSHTDGQDFSGNVSLGINFTKYLQFKSSYSYRGANSQEYYKYPKYVADPKVPRDYPYYSELRSFWQEQVIDNVLSYNDQIKKHSINAMVGASVTLQSSSWNSVGVEGKTTITTVEDGKLVLTEKPGGFLDQDFSTIRAGRGGTYTADGTKYNYNRVSFFGRLNYNYDQKYMVQITVRGDGSSKFGSESRWGIFPSVALAWRMDQESFLKDVEAVNLLKIRASWGRLGNEVRLGYYDYQSLITTGNSLGLGYVQGSASSAWPGSIATGLENRALQWETTESINAGIDYQFFSKFGGSINYYSTQTNDLLITKKLAPSAGITDPVLNVGKIRNSGFEFAINYNDRVASGLGWNVGLNFTTLKNEVVSLADENQILYGTGLKFSDHYPTQTRMGTPIGAFYLYRTDGIFQSDAEAAGYVNSNGDKYQVDAKAGDIKFKDVNGDGIINEKDKEYVGTGLPKLEVNLTLGLNYKGLDFSLLIGGGFGHKFYNGNRYFFEAMNSGSNMLSTTLNAWTPSNKNTDMPRAVLQDPNNNSRESDRFLESGDYVRLRNVQIGYTFPEKWMKKIYIQRLRIFVSGDNLLTFTKYSGIDPEFARKNPLDTGVDNLIYPMTNSFSCGLQITF